MATKITPTVGRVVWFYSAKKNAGRFAHGATYAAIIASVLPDGKLNLGVFDGNGATHSMTKVPLIQEGDTAPSDGYYAAWMPYQIAVAAGKTAEIQHAVPMPPAPPAITPAPVVSAPAPMSPSKG